MLYINVHGGNFYDCQLYHKNKLAPHKKHQKYSIIQLTANQYQPEYPLIVFHICSPHKKHKAPEG